MTIEEITKYREQQNAIYAARKAKKEEQKRTKVFLMAEMAKLYQEDKLTYEEIGKRYGYTRQRVHQLLKEFATLPVSIVADSPIEPITLNAENVYKVMQDVKERLQ